MRWFLAILWGMLLSGCSGPPSPTYTTEVESGDLLSRTRTLQVALSVAGRVSVAELIWELRRVEVLAQWPPSGMRTGIPVEFIQAEAGRYLASDAIRAVEEACGWVFDVEKGVFYVARASHSVDDPDSFGRPQALVRAPMQARPMLQVAFRFRRVSVGVSADQVSASGDGTTFSASLPDGVRETWSKVSERSYFEGVRDANSSTASVVQTERRAVESGIEVDALAARLPGGLFRIDGRIALSSFSGQSLDRAVVDFPLQLDGERGRWCRVVVIKGADVGVGLAFRQFDINPAGSGEAVELSVRVD